MKVKIIPFGEVEQDRWNICLEHKLVECVSGIWRLTNRSKNIYEFESLFLYLVGQVDKPTRKITLEQKD